MYLDKSPFPFLLSWQKGFSLCCFGLLMLVYLSCSETEGKPANGLVLPVTETVAIVGDTLLKLDTVDFQHRLDALNIGDTTGAWAAIKAPYPMAGAILPFQRVVAFYGNFYSKRMGILGELPEDEMLEKLKLEAGKWELADSLTPVRAAIHYIAVTAQRSPGKGRKYRQRMPKAQIEKALAIAKKIDALVILDLQIGLSTLEEELPPLDSFLALPNVHLGIDPEFSMKTGARPGKKIGSFDAADVNYAMEYLAGLVKLHKLPPKILVLHRFTGPMLTNYEDILLLPEVQIVVDMDGWGGKAKKRGTYRVVITAEPVQFAGVKIFYKNDTKKGATEMQPAEVLKLVPKPIYIQYQ